MNKNNQKENSGERQNFPTIEEILRSVEKDEEYTNHILKRVVNVLDSLSYFVSLNLTQLSDKLEFVSRFLYYLCCYHIRGKFYENGKFNSDEKLKQDSITTTGEEYTNIRKNFSKSNSNLILAYVLTNSFRNIFIKYIHNKIISKFENLISRGHHTEHRNALDKHYDSLFYRFKIVLYRIILKFSTNFPTFEQINEKLEEIQFCYFFINGKFYEFVQRMFNFNYVKINLNNSEDEIQISQDGFKFFGYLMAIKLFLELIGNLKKFYKSFKLENQKLNKEISEINQHKNNSLKISESLDESEYKLNEKENLFKFNLKSKKILVNDHLHNPQEEEFSCLLCLDQRTNTSATPCGHLFCWSCLIKYLQSNENCPFCRQKCQASEIILLQNLK